MTPEVAKAECLHADAIEQMVRHAFASTNSTPYTGICKHWYRKGVADGHALAAAPIPAHESARAQAAWNAAIDFAIEQGLEAATFLEAWRHGDTSEWPEFSDQVPK